MDLVRFYAPLATTAILMMASHSLGTLAMNRTAINPALALASFSVAQALGQLFEGLTSVSRQTGMALVKDRQSWAVLVRLFKLTVAAILVVTTVIAFTPLGSVVFHVIMGAPADVAAEATKVFRIYMLLPAITALRFLHHSIIILRKKTIVTTAAMAARIAYMAVATAIFIAHPVPWEGIVGTIVLIGGIGVEALGSFLAGRRLVPGLDTLYATGERKGGRTGTSGNDEGGSVRGTPLTLAAATRFYAPLAASGFVSNLARMAISAGLARTLDPKMALAAYQVSWTIAWMFISPLQTLHQVTLVFAKGADSSARVRRFALAVGAGGAVLIAAFCLTGAARFVLARWLDVAPELIVPALWSMGLMAGAPLIVVCSEIFTGGLLAAGDSVAIGTGRTLYVVLTTITALAGAAVLPALGAVLAPISQVVGFAGEMVFLWARARRMLGPEHRRLIPAIGAVARLRYGQRDAVSRP